MTNPLTITDKQAELHVVVDRTRDLAPQVIVLRSIGLPWKLVELLCGRPKNRLEEQIEAFKQSLAEGRANLPLPPPFEMRQSPPPSRPARARSA